MLVKQRSILLVGKNPDAAELNIRALRKNGIANDLAVPRDDTSIMPAVVLLDLKKPRLDGLEVLQRMRSGPRTHRIPASVRKPVDFNQFTAAVKHRGMYWRLLNQIPPHGASGGGV
jgi:two-component system response regulator